MGEHFARGLDYGDEKGGWKGVVKHNLVELLGIFAGKYSLLSRNIARKHHYDDRDYGVENNVFHK